MSYPRPRANPYEDDRRRSYGYEPYKPPGDRSNHRDLGKEPEQNRGRGMGFGQRNSADAKDTRSPRSIRRDIDAPNSLHIDTRVTNSVRRTTSANCSPTSALNSVASTRPTPTESSTGRVSSADSVSNFIVTPSIPKIKDSKLQEAFDIIYRWNETSQERMLLKLRTGKFLREDNRRQLELNKVTSKVDDYAPYAEFQRRFNECGKSEREDISKNTAKLDQQFADELEKALSSITSVKSQAVDSTMLQALEAQFAEFKKQSSEQEKRISEFQKQSSEQKQHIEEILRQNSEQEKKMSVFQEQSAEQEKQISEFQKQISGFEAQISEQQEQISEAQTQIRGLLSGREKAAQDLENLDRDFKVLKTEYGVLQSENSELKKKIADLDFIKNIQDDVSRLSENLISFTTKVDDMEKKVVPFMSKVEEMDMVSYNEILETWVGHDFGNKVFSLEKTIIALLKDIRSMQELAASRFDANDASIEGVRKSLQTLEKSRLAAPEPNDQASGIQSAQQTFVEEKLNAFSKVLQKTVADSGDAVADMVDEVRDRVDKIEATIKTLGRPEPPQKDTEMAAHMSALEQAGMHLRLAMDDSKKRVDSLEMFMRTLDTQWANLNSRQMAERILKQLDPYGQRNEARVAGVEKELGELKDKVSIIEQNLAVLKSSKSLVGIAKAPSPLGKRQMSPGSATEDPTKKRRLGSNGPNTPLRGGCNNA